MLESAASTWGERLLLNLFSYSLILGPIAFVVLTTKYKLCPGPLQSSALIQRFVYGRGFELRRTNNGHPLRSKDRISGGSGSNERLLLYDNVADIQNRSSSSKSPSKTATCQLLWCFLGLQLSYLIWGVLQEKIMTTEYHVTNAQNRTQNLGNNSNNEKHLAIGDQSPTIRFHDSQFLVLVNRIVAFILAIIALTIDRPKQQPYHYYQQASKPQAPLYEYVYCSLSNILSSWCQYEALKYVNFPTQVLSKSCKIIPVMLMSKIMMHKRYKFTEYLCAFLLSLGMFFFLLNQPVANHHIDTTTSHLKIKLNQTMINNIDKQDGMDNSKSKRLAELGLHVKDSSLLSGLTILAFYLASDSFTSNWQQKLFSSYEITNWQMMAATNFYSIMLTLTSLFQQSTLKPAIELVASSHALLLDCILMSVMSSIGQLFVYYTIKRFGSVIFAVIMTMRQFLAILLSCTIYGHRLSTGSSAGVLLVFLVVSFQMWQKSRQAKSKELA